MAIENSTTYYVVLPNMSGPNYAKRLNSKTYEIRTRLGRTNLSQIARLNGH
jgi:hypothetical protein